MPERESSIQDITFAHEVEIESTDSQITRSAMARRETGGMGEYFRGDSRTGLFTLINNGFRRIAAYRRARNERPPRDEMIEEIEIAEGAPNEVYISHMVDNLIDRTMALRNKVDTNKIPFDLTATVTGRPLPEGQIQVLASGSRACPISEADADELIPGRPKSRGELRLGFAIRRHRPETTHRELGQMPTHARAPKGEPHDEVEVVLLDAYRRDEPYARIRGHYLDSRVLTVDDLRDHDETLTRIVRNQNVQLKRIEDEPPGNRVY